MPERFLHDDGTLNEDTIPCAFGFGRRMLCVNINATLRIYRPNMAHSPGKHVEDASLWSAMVRTLALFRIEKTEGSENLQ